VIFLSRCPHERAGNGREAITAPENMADRPRGQFDEKLKFLSSDRDLPVDAEDTPQPAVGEKDRSRASLPHERALLSEMRVVRGYLELRRGVAESLGTLEPVDVAPAGAELAFLHDPP